MQEFRADAVDLKILAALQRRSDVSTQRLAELVGLSASQCSRRRAALEASGVVEGYRAILSAERLGLKLVAFVEVSLSAHSPETAQNFADALAQTDAVQEAYAVTGDADYMLKVIVADLGELSRLLNDALMAQPGVAKVRSSIALHQLKSTTALPLPRRSARGRG